ncbi:MAG: zinc ribbon domain-containing protein [Anaerolineales bacterium]|nr:zinc ribbon domain-containing protein [Anaerolineales bacterium]
MKFDTFVQYVIAGIFLVAFFPTDIGPWTWGAAAIWTLWRGISLINEGVEEVNAARRQWVHTPPAFSSRPASAQPTAAVRPFQFNLPEHIPTDLKCPSCGASIGPTTRKCEYCGSILQPVIDLPDPVHLAGLTIGKGVRVRLAQGERDFRVQGRALLAELWQATRGPNVPWTFTGNLYAGFALSGVQTAYLLNWQNRFYLFEQGKTVNDLYVQQHFLPHARAFGQSDQMGRVEFPYEGRRWQLTDIGRSQVIFTEGQGLHVQRGAEARFLYAESGELRLMVEDYRAGGAAQDRVWMGYQVEESDIEYAPGS